MGLLIWGGERDWSGIQLTFPFVLNERDMISNENAMVGKKRSNKMIHTMIIWKSAAWMNWNQIPADWT